MTSAGRTTAHTFNLSSNSLHFEQNQPVRHLGNTCHCQGRLKIPTFYGRAFFTGQPSEAVTIPKKLLPSLRTEQNGNQAVAFMDDKPLYQLAQGKQFSQAL